MVSRGKPNLLGKDKVSIRVLFSQQDYEALKEIARVERSDIGTLVRRAVARYFFMPYDGNLSNRR